MKKSQFTDIQILPVLKRAEGGNLNYGAHEAALLFLLSPVAWLFLMHPAS